MPHSTHTHKSKHAALTHRSDGGIRPPGHTPLTCGASRVEASVRCAIVINTFPTPSDRTQRALSTYSAPWARSILATALTTHPHTRHTIETIQPCVPCAKIQRQGIGVVGCAVSSHEPGMFLGSPCCSSHPHNTAKKKSTRNNKQHMQRR